MVYITGDLHGDIDRFRKPEFSKLKKGDTLIVCGDFGFIWNDSRNEKKILKWLGKRKYNIAFIEGCHDNYDLLGQYEETEWCGGKVHNISGRLFHMIRGSVYTIENQTFFAFGGGESDDYEERIAEDKWWQEEQPSKDEVDTAVENLNKADFTIDYIITHDAPRALNGAVDIDADKQSYIHVFLDIVCKQCNFKMWFFGKYHMDKTIPPRYRGLFRDIVAVPSGKKLK